MTDTTKRYLVTADHRIAKHACVDLLAECRTYATSDASKPALWYAVMAGYGCSKNYRTPEAAIREMLLDHACSNIRIRPLDKVGRLTP